MASKWMSTAEAVRTYIKDGDQIALGGFTFNRNPMSITREIIRQHKKGNSGDTILNYTKREQGCFFLRSHYFLFVRYAPPMTMAPPVTREMPRVSLRRKKARMTALTGTKLINTAAREAPIFCIPS